MELFGGPVHFFVMLCAVAFIILSVYPIFRIVSRTGHSGWWCLVSFVPVLNWIFLWVFAFARWPAIDKG
jgi:hypothetical protein